MLHLHIFIDDSIYGLWRHIVKRKFEFDFEFSLHCPYTSVKGKLFNNDIEVSSRQLKRFNQSVIDPKCLLKIAARSFYFDSNLSFSSNIIFSFYFKQQYVAFFIWEIRFTCFPKWPRILINTKFLKVQRFDVFIQICQQVSLSLKLENVARTFLTYFFCFWDAIWSSFASVGCMGSNSRHAITIIQFKLVTVILLEIAVYQFLWFKLFKFCFENNVYHISLKPVSKEFVSKNENFDFVISKFMYKPSSPLEHLFCFIIL